jgi:DNA-binding SARP family transcriptional activator/tetratricopeptide (TPR) repeat protein
VELKLLGPFEAHDDRGALPIGTLRQRAVLALLTIHVGRTLATERIIDEIWAGTPPPTAVKTLQAYISRLRRVLHGTTGEGRGPVLLSRPQGYVLDVDPSAVDSVRFECMADVGAELVLDQRHEEAAARLRAALEIWRGPALVDFVYEPFAGAEAGRLTERRLEAIELRIDADLALARHGAVTAELEALVLEHPLRERLWAQLMTALYRSGRQADALSAYGRIRAALVDELGIDPGPELRTLERQVLEQDPALAWRPPRWSSGPSRAEGRSSGAGDEEPAGAGSLPLVGRGRHLEVLTESVATAGGGGPPRLVVLMGEAGCGKTRLLAELTRISDRLGALVAQGSAERDVSLPYGPFSGIVRSVLAAAGDGSLDRIGHLRSDLVWLLPELGPQPEPGGDLGQARARLFEAVAQLLATAGDGGPVVVMVDDAHRLSEGVSALVDSLLTRTWARPVVVVLAARTDPLDRMADLSPFLVGLMRADGTTVLEVERLTDAELGELAVGLVGDRTGADPSALAVRLAELTAGIPLLVREVLAAGVESGPLPPFGDLGRAVSPLVDAIVGHRLDQLSPPARRIVELAAVVGQSFDLTVLALVADSPLPEVEVWVDEARRAGLVRETEAPDIYAFDHGLIRDVSGRRVPAGRQVRIHGAVASALSTQGSPVQAARHALLGYTGISAGRAGELAVAGAERALEELDFETAIGLCAEALAGPALEAGPGARAELLLRMGRARSLAGRQADAEAAFAEAAELARKLEDPNLLARVALATGTIGRLHSDASELRWTLLGEALERTGPAWSELRLMVAAAWLLEASMPYRRMAEPSLVDEVVAAAEELGDTRALVTALHMRSVLARERLAAERTRWLGEFLAVAESLDEPEWWYRAHSLRLIDAVFEGNGAEVDRSLDLLRQACADYREPRALWIFELIAASCARLRGEFDVGDERGRAAVDLGVRLGIPDAGPASGAGAVLTTYFRGGLGDLRELIGAVFWATPSTPAWAFAAGMAAVDAGDPDDGRAWLARGMEALADQPAEVWLAGLCLAAELVGLVGADPPTLERLTRLLLPFTGHFAVIGAFSSEFGPVDRALGILLTVGGELDRAVEHFERALAVCEGLRARPWALRTRVDWLLAERTAGRPPRSWWDDLGGELDAHDLGATAARLASGTLGSPPS